MPVVVVHVVPDEMMIPFPGPVIVPDSELDMSAVSILLEQNGITVEGVSNMAICVAEIASLSNHSHSSRAVRAEETTPVCVCIDTAQRATYLNPSEEVYPIVPAPFSDNTCTDSDTERVQLYSYLVACVLSLRRRLVP